MISAPSAEESSLTHLLKGVFAYSYSGYHALHPSARAPDGPPEIGSYLERTRPAGSVASQRAWEFYDEIEGYVLVDCVGWIDFHGDGELSGGGTSQRAGGRAIPFTHSGTYVVESALGPMLEDQRTPGASVILTRAIHGSESGRAMKFTVVDGDAGQLVASGTMMQGW